MVKIRISGLNQKVLSQHVLQEFRYIIQMQLPKPINAST